MAMWDIEGLPAMVDCSPADRLWIIALALEEAGGPADHVRALRDLAECLEELGWWLAVTTRRANRDQGPGGWCCEPERNRAGNCARKSAQE
jgi:hypothetical protein